MDSSEFGLPTETDVFEEIAKSEQQIRVSILTKRYGKKSTLIEGLDKSVDLKMLAKHLKEELACGGTAKNGVIELQGDHRKKVKPILMKMGFSESSISD